ncbi:uncharacterized protein LOC111695851 [Eurytemora carolleeae]|uniref:uncharacterized protein LOC111695851 n=1 Tax=Eurytemora carolleeae TaxID=1294199 RepID=UPI000C757466|nr:uncharacterized protein LOC111695851 [Eurytemora carolleeae]|eukprot:XP_023321077.1 uncharacterized protein LOC111695851 [Eurytemora affinis]
MDPHVELRELLISNYEDYGGRLGLNIPWDLNLPVFPCTNSSCILEYRERRNLMKREASEEKEEEVPQLNNDGPAVLYLPLGGGGGGGCPSLAESAVVGVSQMVFLWTVMSVFNVVANVVANINNNQNNNNNNNNNLQINKISTQNTQISANTNNANTITIMLPPPIPVLAGGRRLDAQRRLKRFVERERKLEERKKGIYSKDLNFLPTASNIFKSVLDSDGLISTECLGRHLCHLSKDETEQLDFKQSVALKTMTFALMWMKLEDRSQSFVEFLDNMVLGNLDQDLDCDLIFYTC